MDNKSTGRIKLPSNPFGYLIEWLLPPLEAFVTLPSKETYFGFSEPPFAGNSETFPESSQTLKKNGKSPAIALILTVIAKAEEKSTIDGKTISK